MRFDASKHRCTIVIEQSLASGLAVNAASVIGITFGRTVENLVGPDMQSMDGITYPGVIYAPLPVLVASGDYLRELQEMGHQQEDLYVVPFSALAQSCKTYDEYGGKINSVPASNIELVALGLMGPKKAITRLTGNLKLYR